MKSFVFIADTINGEICEFPFEFYLPCNDRVQIEGMIPIRGFTPNDCIEVRRVFAIKFGDDLLGSTQFQSRQEFLDYQAAACSCSQILMNGCNITLNGCLVIR